ncbi:MULTISPECIES: flagellar hook-associated protein FlgK [Pseudoalteromonas]|jgi:flagellar hook-associated protein 1 FlgK|uniref:flagellar hook-associated protein FlgK n=1 Tax=Pseudoalteromonas TaxID=53246 RepID=UPI0001EF8C81|nr:MULTISPECIES: flagellar hook-associated protein FlgK [Pseudoalteromonas]PHQ91076.1 MAG: flagellar hook-associated protein FlgK [Pseudoalteromonas sp.]ADT69199.1 flagellar hook-associated [Pseudoalteromonas sp. SM9913]MDN3395774.1 flagellar hook-associated protein FlgK [Pseudoalteromonas sp. APC 3215]MDN3404617.1 flagellar hook-associated protein FlgK [Pseudoalteromonas sp. APC 3218]MDN3408413.1 flagellar hook-associated protein FlgK [Pseudoalteromonas sp. APC 3894]|tara:strand:+ start:17360 stop:19366 length:2007 start_codon:yes stop_codon:yes gene_type:complete
MSFNLLNIANSGIRANSELLQTTSKNIANVNTEGYVRERTEFTTMIDNQVGRGQTYRLLNEFAQKQLNRDTSNKSFFDQFVSEASRVDQIFSEKSNSLSTSINSMFNNVQEALNQPSSTVARSLVMSDAQNLIDQMDRLAGIVSEQKAVVNEQLEIFSEEANTLIESISSLNQEIAGVHGTKNEADASSAYNERDKAIRDLSKLIDIETLDGPNGEKQVFMGTGEAVVMQNGSFNLFSISGDPDANFKELRLDVNGGQAVPLEIDPTKLKGKIGGLLAFRDDILVPAQNQIGQMGIALADSFNQQNRLGMDANGELGGDIFDIPTVSAFVYQANTGTANMSATVEAGKGSELPASDFVITYTGNPNEVSIQPIDNKGEPLGSASLAVIPPSGIIDSAAITSGESFGLELNVTGAGNAGDQFQIKLNSGAAGNISLTTGRGEDIALASPIRTADGLDNTGTGTISPGDVSDVTTGSFTNPLGLANGPINIVKTANANEYQLTDGNGTTTFTVIPPANNILAQAGPPYDGYGFDFNIEGVPATGDTFNLEFNEGGFDDNRNGQKLADLQNSDLVRQNVVASASADNHKTLNQAYAGLVTDVGVVTSQAKTNGAAFDALAQQSEAWYESLSGVNLDEEAANLLRFQQSYAASAQVLSAARSIFDTLLSAAR